MSWYELLLAIHILAAALWFGSGIAITAMSYKALRDPPGTFAAMTPPATWWAGRAHPGSAVVILLAGFGLVAEGDLSLGETWIVLALVGWVLLMALGGGLVGPTATKLEKELGTGRTTTADARPLADRLLLLMRVETALLALVIVDMVVKPG